MTRLRKMVPEELQRRNAAELLSSTGDLTTANEVDVLLGTVTQVYARKLVDRKDAVAIGCLSQ